METTVINIIIPPAEPVLVVATSSAPEPVTVNSEEIASPVSVTVETPAATPVNMEVQQPTVTPVLVTVSYIGERGPAGLGAEGSLNYIIDAGTSVITTGLKGFVEWGFAATITGWTILSDVLGNIVIDIWKDNYGNFQPTVADTIAGTEKPTLVNSQKNQDLSLTSFSTTVLKGDIWAFNVDSVNSIKKVTIAFRFNKN